MKYKIIKNIHVKEIVKMNGVEMTMRKVLYRIKVNRNIPSDLIPLSYYRGSFKLHSIEIE